jgi:hypothetical protein
MSTAPKRAGVMAEVRGRRAHLESAVRKCILDANSERERVAGLWMEHMFHYGPVWFTLGGGPWDPTNEAMDRITALRLVQWELVVSLVEFIAPSCNRFGHGIST